MAWFFPSGLYTDIYGDTSFIFLDLKTFVYVSLCITATLIGLGVSLRIGERPSIINPPLSPFSNAPLTEFLLILTCCLMSLGSLTLLVRSGAVSAFGAAVSSTGERMSQEFKNSDEGDENAGPEILLVPVSFAIPLIFFSTRSSGSRARNKYLFYAVIAMYIVVAMVTTKRNVLMRPGFACLLVFLAWPSMKRFSTNKGIGLSLGAAFLFVLIFISLSIVRFGFDGFESSVSEIGRYLITPYNTAALLINDKMRMPGGGTGYYWTQFLWQFPVVSEQLGLSDIREQWFGDKPLYGALERGPFLKSYGITTGTAIPAFACSYIDFGWLGILPFFFTGILCGYAWKSFLLGRLSGICFYPVIAYSFLEWRGNLYFPPPTLGIFLAVFLAIVFCRYTETSIKRKNAAF